MTIDDLINNSTLRQVALLIVVVLVIVTLTKLLRGAAARAIDDVSARYRVRKLVSALGYLAVLIAAMSIISGQLSSVAMILSALSVGVGFALQEVIASVAGWLALSFGKFYEPGDRIELGGILGDVIDIGVLRTTVMECGGWVKGDLYNGRIVRVANSFVFKAPVFNYSGDFPFLWDEIQVPITFGTDYKLARKILESAATDIIGDFAQGAKDSWAKLVREYRVEDAQLDPMVTMIFNDNWIEFTVRYPVNYRARRTTKDQLFQRILEDIDATKGKVGLASATFQLVGAPPITVRLESPPKV